MLYYLFSCYPSHYCTLSAPSCVFLLTCWLRRRVGCALHLHWPFIQHLGLAFSKYLFLFCGAYTIFGGCFVFSALLERTNEVLYSFSVLVHNTLHLHKFVLLRGYWRFRVSHRFIPFFFLFALKLLGTISPEVSIVLKFSVFALIPFVCPTSISSFVSSFLSPVCLNICTLL